MQEARHSGWNYAGFLPEAEVTLTILDHRAMSAFVASNSTSRAPSYIPGRDSASAANAPDLTTCRIHTKVVRSTPGRIATSPRT